jgi:hypothetical protein
MANTPVFKFAQFCPEQSAFHISILGKQALAAKP